MAGLFFNIFEKTQAQKNSTARKTQGFFRQKLSEPVVKVVAGISKFIQYLAFGQKKVPKTNVKLHKKFILYKFST